MTSNVGKRDSTGRFISDSIRENRMPRASLPTTAEDAVLLLQSHGILPTENCGYPLVLKSNTKHGDAINDHLTFFIRGHRVWPSIRPKLISQAKLGLVEILSLLYDISLGHSHREICQASGRVFDHSNGHKTVVNMDSVSGLRRNMSYHLPQSWNALTIPLEKPPPIFYLF